MYSHRMHEHLEAIREAQQHWFNATHGLWGNQAHIVGAPAALGGMSSMKLEQPYLNDHVTILERTLIPWGTTEQVFDEQEVVNKAHLMQIALLREMVDRKEVNPNKITFEDGK